jgi:hypothetical protein
MSQDAASFLRKSFEGFRHVSTPEKHAQLNELRVELSKAVDSLDLSMFTHRKTLDALAACDDHIAAIQFHRERAAERMCEAVLWQRDPVQLCPAIPPGDEDSDCEIS